MTTTLKVSKTSGGYGGQAGFYVTCTCCESESDIFEDREDATWMAASGECHYCASDCDECLPLASDALAPRGDDGQVIGGGW